jgi:hypothetical protein
VNRRTLELRAAAAAAATVKDAKSGSSGQMPKEFLLAISQNDALDLSVRVDAAKAVIGFVSPKLIAQHNLNETRGRYYVKDEPMSETEWSAEFTGPGVIEGRDVPLVETVGNIHNIEVEVRDKRILQLEEEIAKLRHALNQSIG